MRRLLSAIAVAAVVSAPAAVAFGPDLFAQPEAPTSTDAPQSAGVEGGLTVVLPLGLFWPNA
ncbi:hypothetical protein L6E12_03110 [Actinokineospora sp. PR83]|uniref:hypothetical protein n=1 Tax=Actinokineospora sp. PR83 TaxID=2884908 RepID=UPI001F3E7926|nr:hypothetical protein [Actinokineospora sp. PR83]MCG8914785.1 hypothetical protein [Actinokineospora sp. PR83]